MRDLKCILKLRFENHSQREIARILGVSRNTVRDIFDAQDAAGAYWNVVCDMTESQIEEQAYKSCLSILKLSDKYSQARLENACQLALERLTNPTYRNIRLILESGQDEAKHEENSNQNEDTTYAFMRGAKYYGGNER